MLGRSGELRSASCAPVTCSAPLGELRSRVMRSAGAAALAERRGVENLAMLGELRSRRGRQAAVGELRSGDVRGELRSG